MAKVLVIRKPDKTIHKVPLAVKASLQAQNNRLPADKKWTFEEMEESEAAKLPFVDPNYVTGTEAIDKLKELTDENAAKDSLLAELQAKLDAIEKAEKDAAAKGAAAGKK